MEAPNSVTNPGEKEKLSLKESIDFERAISYYLHEKEHQTHLRDPNNRKKLEEAMNAVYSRKNTLISIDVEAWERDSKCVTEIGIAVYDPKKQTRALLPAVTSIHILLRDNISRKNGRFVPDHSENFNGEYSYILSEAEAVKLVKNLVNYYMHDHELDCYLVGHDIRGDLNWLEGLGVVISKDTKILDTQKIYAASHGKRGGSLKNALRMACIPHAFLHNAGNDAYYTILLALALCDPVRRELSKLDHSLIEKSSIYANDIPKQEGIGEKNDERENKHKHSIPEAPRDREKTLLQEPQNNGSINPDVICSSPTRNLKFKKISRRKKMKHTHNHSENLEVKDVDQLLSQLIR